MRTWLLKIPRWWGSVIVIATVLYLTLWPDPLPDNDIPFWEHTDKVVHGVMMFGVYCALWLDLTRMRVRPRTYICVLALAVIAFGGGIELIQRAMAMGRGAAWGDFAADVAGTLAAIPLCNRLSKNRD